MGKLDYITILIFVVGVMAAGMSFSSTGKNMKGFFAGGGNVPWWISGLSLFMGFFSAGTFVVWGSIAYSLGWVAVTIQLTMALAGFAVGAAIAPRWNRTGCLTAAEYITKRFGAGTQKIYTYIFLFISLFTTGAFLYPIAKIIEVSTGLPLQASILLLGVFCILYVSIGGLRAVVVTDVLQFLILLAAVIIVIPLALERIGGVGNFLDKAPAGFFDILSGEYSWVFIVAFMFYNLFFLGGNWAYVQQGANTEYYRRLIDSGIPVVFFNRTDDRLDAGKVVIDDYRMAFFAVEHLIIGRGEPFRTRIMHLRGPESISNSTLRWQGYCDVLRKYGIEPEGSLVRRCAEISRQAGYDAMMTALDEGLVPEAVFGFNDPLSIGAMKALKRRGYRIPQDVAVMGFSESQSALLVDPPLSSVAQPLDRMGESAARLLLEKIDDPSAENRTVVLQADINIRESSDETKIGQYIPLP